jgi:hypothetical protein
VLAAVGIYSVLSYTVEQRLHEIGIRMVLGASRENLLRLVLAQGLRLSLIGVLLGIVAALGGARLLAGLLHGVGAADPATYVVLSIGFTGVALDASWIPARRAVRTDPADRTPLGLTRLRARVLFFMTEEKRADSERRVVSLRHYPATTGGTRREEDDHLGHRRTRHTRPD